MGARNEPLLLQMLCDVAGDAKRAEEAGKQPSTVDSSVSRENGSLQSNKTSDKAKLKETNRSTPLGSYSATKSEGSEQVDKKVEKTATKDRKRSRGSGTESSSVSRPLKRGNDHNKVGSKMESRRCADLERALRESKKTVHKLQEDKAALQKRCIQVESILYGMPSGPPNLPAGVPYPVSQPYYGVSSSRRENHQQSMPQMVDGSLNFRPGHMEQHHTESAQYYQPQMPGIYDDVSVMPVMNRFSPDWREYPFPRETKH
eukprot:CAMPEP_0184752616 /NCGR_PEP_ID=MMETSP0315-20130426/43672_1 /TAXON_ID=101924 /ORGANISM="Rhodosorus marinus, Strain UTEX LB 2760" /LENGTH=258 /DNA_ID=CAMNT_0027231957 /DNA_START=841 /DNA_END=1617 /DNA_ORIENTATION=-